VLVVVQHWRIRAASGRHFQKQNETTTQVNVTNNHICKLSPWFSISLTCIEKNEVVKDSGAKTKARVVKFIVSPAWSRARCD